MALYKLISIIVFLFCVQQFSLICGEEEAKFGYESCPVGDPEKLNVHLICHTHNDVGWLKTVSQYYYGAKQDIQRAGVQYILDSVIDALKKDPKKKFIYVETAFFYMWWNNQHDMIRHRVKKLVCDGQLEFIGGGWSMNDEAATHYNSIIDQMTWGLRILNDTFGKCGIPKVAWQIDPFGHSREQASLFAQMFYDGLFLGRLDYQDKDQRMESKTMEHLWKGSGNLGAAGDLFTGVLPNAYSPPPGFCFDILCDDPPIMDDYKDNNVEKRVADFIGLAEEQAKYYATNHLVMTMGNDFNYQSADSWYTNLDKLIFYVNKKQSNGSKVNVFYSTPSCYLYSLHRANRTWTTKTDDFLPYASDPHAYWTGYFTSRPSIKRYERIGNNNLQMCKQLSALADIDDFDVTFLRQAMGIMQHHDAITGTAKQSVTYDYAETLASAIDTCQKEVVPDSLKKFLPVNQTEIPQQYFCNYLNISECDITEGDKPVAVTIYNPLGWNISTYVRLPVNGTAYKVYDPTGAAVTAQLVDIPTTVQKIAGRKSAAKAELVFKIDLPALGFSTYLMRKSPNAELAKEQKSVVKYSIKGDWKIGNEFFTLTVNGNTGLLSGISLADTTNLTLNQSFYWYRGMNGNNSKAEFRASGAYIFRPNGSIPIPLGSKVTVTFVNGSLVQEIRQVFNSWLSQIIRVYKGVENAEFNWIVGPIPVEDKIGKEIITRFDSDLKNDDRFYTDSNGREIQTRRKNYRPTWKLNVTEPVSGNYYPVNSRIYIRDKQRNLQITILTDRSQGGSSMNNGSVELMIHRRLLQDDAFGVGEALNEPGVDGKGLVIRGSHYLIVSDIPFSASKHRPLAQKLYLQPTFSFAYYNSTEADYINSYTTKFSGLNSSLPANVHLLTLEPWKKATKLIRLEHFYEFYEDPVLSKPAKIDLASLFSPFQVVSINETTLSANQFLTEAQRLSWNSNDNFLHFIMNSSPRKTQRHGLANNDLEISLAPMQIRTFIATVK